jgi:hypothetical protein
MTMTDDYQAYKQRQADNAEATKQEKEQQRKQESEEKDKWFETFIRWRFNNELSGITKDYIYDNSTQTRIGPLKPFDIAGFIYYLYPVEKGRFDVYTPSLITGQGCDRIGTFTEDFNDDQLFEAIKSYQDSAR